MLPTVTKLAELLTVGDSSFAGSEEFQAVRPRSYPVDDDPHFVPITDQKPFLAGNVRYILSMTQVVQLFGLAVAYWAWPERRSGGACEPGRSPDPGPAIFGRRESRAPHRC